jgi:hypothetical protein
MLSTLVLTPVPRVPIVPELPELQSIFWHVPRVPRVPEIPAMWALFWQAAFSLDSTWMGDCMLGTLGALAQLFALLTWSTTAARMQGVQMIEVKQH